VHAWVRVRVRAFLFPFGRPQRRRIAKATSSLVVVESSPVRPNRLAQTLCTLSTGLGQSKERACGTSLPSWVWSLLSSTAQGVPSWRGHDSGALVFHPPSSVDTLHNHKDACCGCTLP